MSKQIFHARFRRIEKAMPLEPYEVEVSIQPLPPPEERKRIEAENPTERYFWIDSETIRERS
jgi:hypothetical protein